MIERVGRGFRIVSLLFRLSTLSFSLIYLVYCMGAGRGIFGVNLTFLILGLMYAIFMIVMTFHPNRKASKVGARIYRWLRLLVTAANIGLVVYGFMISKDTPSFWNYFLLSMMIVTFSFKLFFEVITFAIEIKIAQFKKERKERLERKEEASIEPIEVEKID